MWRGGSVWMTETLGGLDLSGLQRHSEGWICLDDRGMWRGGSVWMTGEYGWVDLSG